jgi:hypothetical protein
MIFLFSCSGLYFLVFGRASLPCLHDIVERLDGIRQLVKEIFSRALKLSGQRRVMPLIVQFTLGCRHTLLLDLRIGGIEGLTPISSFQRINA